MFYNTAHPAPTPITPAMRAEALLGLSASVPGVNEDVYGNLSAANKTAYGRRTQMQNAQEVDRARQAQQQLAMRGLEQMAQYQQNAMNLGNRRQEMAGNMVNSLLSGLFR